LIGVRTKIARPCRPVRPSVRTDSGGGRGVSQGNPTGGGEYHPFLAGNRAGAPLPILSVTQQTNKQTEKKLKGLCHRDLHTEIQLNNIEIQLNTLTYSLRELVETGWKVKFQ